MNDVKYDTIAKIYSGWPDNSRVYLSIFVYVRFNSRDNMPKVTWCLKPHGSLYLAVKYITLVHN